MNTTHFSNITKYASVALAIAALSGGGVFISSAWLDV